MANSLLKEYISNSIDCLQTPYSKPGGKMTLDHPMGDDSLYLVISPIKLNQCAVTSAMLAVQFFYPTAINDCPTIHSLPQSTVNFS